VRFDSHHVSPMVLAAVVSGAGFFDFTASSIQDPLSLGGQFSTATNGVGGNAPVADKADLRIALASDGSTKIAQHSSTPVDPLGSTPYADSFAFLPNVSASGNIRVTARLYRNPAYTPTDNHELEIILGCKSTTANSNKDSRWIECLYTVQGGGGCDIVSLDGLASSFTLLGGSVAAAPAIVDGSLFKGELDRAAGRVRWWVDTTGTGTSYTLHFDKTDALIASLGSGGGIAAFMRPGDTNPAGCGFRSVLIEAF
jgi:hypothetical protein